MPFVAAGGTLSFAEWLGGMPLPDLHRITADAAAFVEAEGAWRKTLVKDTVAKLESSMKKRAFRVNYKFAVGSLFSKWQAGPGKTSRAPLKDRAL